jgi:hypothetical protein
MMTIKRARRTLPGNWQRPTCSICNWVGEIADISNRHGVTNLRKEAAAHKCKEQK